MPARSFLTSSFAPSGTATEPSHEMRACPQCGREHLLPLDDPAAQCFKCWRAENPFAGSPGIRIDAAGDDSIDPRRVADKTAVFNSGLRGVDIPVGRRPDGSVATEYRPLSNREVSSNANLREIAKRQGLVPYESSGVYRSPKLR